MGSLRSLALLVSAIVGSVGAFGAAGYLGGNFFIDYQNRSQLRQLNEFVLRRAELEADFAIIALTDLVVAGAAGCDAASLVQMRQQVYERSTVKDIRVLDASGRSICAAFQKAPDTDTAVVNVAEASSARNQQIRLFRVAQNTTAALGLHWQITPDLAMVAVLNTDALLFDVLPPELHGRADLRLTLPTGDVVAEFSQGRVTEALSGGVFASEARSGRYPLVSQLTVDAQALANWNKGLEKYLLAGAAGLGLVFGVLLAGVIVPRRTFLSEIDEALAAGEFRPFAQPVFSLSTGAITGCEILARWVRRDGSMISPYRFIALAEETGRIVPLTRSLIREALSDLRPILTRDRAFKVAFNISPRHFVSAGFVEEIRDLVVQAKAPLHQVVLEITERQELSDLAMGADLIRRPGACRIRVAIDDAGTGHNGLSYLQKLGAQILKIDKFFVDAIETDYSARVIVEMLVKAARELGMATVAEGIERPEQLSWLRDIGVDEGQGFLVSPAIPLRDLASFLEARASAISDGKVDGLAEVA